MIFTERLQEDQSKSSQDDLRKCLYVFCSNVCNYILKDGEIYLQDKQCDKVELHNSKLQLMIATTTVLFYFQ